ncbi:MAG: PQQ-binding-like beta-propeller repeat protein [Rhodospirillales bacterium]|nr:PQQ-binding-like beta-propeller repeat protein [Rhodospirillales bacterium]
MPAVFSFCFASMALHAAAQQTDGYRSYSDNQSSRYSTLDLINRDNVQNLERAWVYNFSGNPNAGFSVNQATPIFAGDVIATPSVFGSVLGLDPKTGEQIWKKRLPSPVGKRGITSQVIAGQSVLFIPTSQGVYALNSTDGSRAAHIGKNGIFESHTSVVPPVLSQTHLFVATMNKGVQAFEIATGNEVWTTTISSGNLSPRIWSGLSYDQKTETVFVVTSDAGGLIGRDRAYDIDYSSSLIAISALTGDIKWHFQETIHGLWDLDLAGAPIIAEFDVAGKPKRSVIALSKTGNVIVLDILTGQPVYKDSVVEITAPPSDVAGEQASPVQKTILVPEPVAQIQINPETDFRDDTEEDAAYIKIKTRRAKFGAFVAPSFNYDVVLYGLHGGANRTGGAYDPSAQRLIVPANHEPWFLRLFKSDKIYQAIIRKRRSFRRLQDWTGIDYNSDKDHAFEIAEQVYSLLPFVGRNDNYKTFCAACHGLARQGYLQSEFEGGTYYPSLIGITNSDKFDHLRSVESFKAVHRFANLEKNIDEISLKDIRDYIESADQFLTDYDWLEDKGAWQLFVGRDGHPATRAPWGTITSIDLSSGKHDWRIPFGKRLDKDDQVIAVGDINFGGILASAGKVIFATGTSDNYARAYDTGSGQLLWEAKLPFSGSTSPMTYVVGGCQIVLFTATGGDFFGFEKAPGSLVAFKDKTCTYQF